MSCCFVIVCDMFCITSNPDCTFTIKIHKYDFSFRVKVSILLKSDAGSTRVFVLVLGVSFPMSEAIIGWIRVLGNETV